MSAVETWLAIFILGVLIFMVGVLVPHRVASLAGAAITLVGGVGWFIQSLT